MRPASLGPGRYTPEGTCELLPAHLAALDAAQRVTLVLHDWCSALGFHWPEKACGIFQGFRSPKDEDLML
jgi:haloalkane dehalogenase